MNVINVVLASLCHFGGRLVSQCYGLIRTIPTQMLNIGLLLLIFYNILNTDFF